VPVGCANAVFNDFVKLRLVNLGKWTRGGLLLVAFAGVGLLILLIMDWRSFRSCANYPPRRGSWVLISGELMRPGPDRNASLPLLLGQHVGRPVLDLNLGVTTSVKLLQRIGDLEKSYPSVVIVCLGPVDLGYLKGTREFFDEMRQIILSMESLGVFVVVLEVPDDEFARVGVDEDGQHFRELARSTKAFFIPNVLEGVIGSREFTVDYRRPNAKGYDYIAYRVARRLESVAWKTR